MVLLLSQWLSSVAAGMSISVALKVAALVASMVVLAGCAITFCFTVRVFCARSHNTEGKRGLRDIQVGRAQGRWLGRGRFGVFAIQEFA